MSLPDTSNSPEWEQRYPRASNFMEVNGHRMHYLDQGRGAPAVMVHGNPTWSFFFRDLITALSPEFRCIAIDHIGCGLSAKPTSSEYGFQLKERIADFTLFLKKLALKKPVTLIAHDWGGMIAMAWAVQNPEKVVRLVLMNTAAFFPPAGKKLPWQLRLLKGFPGLARFAVLNFNLFAKGACHLAVRKKLPPDVKAGYLAPYNTPRNRLATLRFVQDIPVRPRDPGYYIVCETEKRLERLSEHPCLFIWGGRDFVFDKDYFDEWRRRFPHAETHYFDEAGHYILEDESKAVILRIQHFLATQNTKKHNDIFRDFRALGGD